MNFNSLTFIAFFAVVFAVYWWIPKRVAWQNLVLLIASIGFYASWDIYALLLLIVSVLWTYAIAILIETSGRSRSRKLRMLIGVFGLLSVLAYFKYFNFFLDSFAIVTGVCTARLELILPLGVSFYTFMSIGYIVDVYKGKVSAERNLMVCSLFLMFFPQISSGPIGRSFDLLPQYRRSRCFDYPLAIEGSRQLLWGLVKKRFVADSCAVASQELLNVNGAGWLAIWLGVLFYTFQIYADFSSYSDMAIGCAKLLGIRLPRNFSYPYFSKNVSEFWRRWHMSLMAWLRDYVYIPLGGNRRGRFRTYFNTFSVFLVSGLWHGANWTFVLWGVFHAICFMPFLLLKGRKQLPAMIGCPLTFLVAALGWALFMAPSVTTACSWYKTMFSFSGGLILGGGANWQTVKVAGWSVLIMMIWEWFSRDQETLVLPPVRCLRLIIYAVAISLFFMVASAPSSFVYFKF